MPRRTLRCRAALGLVTALAAVPVSADAAHAFADGNVAAPFPQSEKPSPFRAAVAAARERIGSPYAMAPPAPARSTARA